MATRRQLPMWLAIAAVVSVVIWTYARDYYSQPCPQANDAFEAAEYGVAVELYTKCLDDDDLPEPDLASIYSYRGDAYFELEAYEDALWDYTEVIGFNPDDAWAYVGRGYAYMEQGAFDNAISDFTVAIRLDPNDAWNYNNRCWTYGLNSMPEKALQDCNKALTLLPDEPAILDSRALAYWLLDRHNEARQDAERAHNIDPTLLPWQERFREFEVMFK